MTSSSVDRAAGGGGEGGPAAVIVLAAGEGTRMRSKVPKVLHELGGRSLLGHAVHVAAPLRPGRLAVVVGHGRELVRAHLDDLNARTGADARPVVQEEQRGTGHAVRTALAALPRLDGTVVVTCGDVPLLSERTLRRLVDEHAAGRRAVTVLTAVVPDATGYGRILRDDTGAVSRIVEEPDASADERRIAEVNSGIYAFDAAALADGLAHIRADNSKHEEYLTDVLGVLAADGHRVGTVTVPDHHEVLGVNDRVQLAQLRRVLNDRVLERWMRAGVTVVDPVTTWVDVTVALEPDVTLAPSTLLYGSTAVASDAHIGPDCTLIDTRVESGAEVVRTHAIGSWIGPRASVGPYAHLRPGSRLGAGSKVGAFVETKNAEIGEGTKVPHLSYVGDATVGDGANIGAGTIVANYDGVAKYHTTVGAHSFIGSDSVLVAPVRIADGAYVAAGSTVVGDVPPGALAVARGRQHVVEGWVARRRAGTATAEAARRAMERGPDAGKTGDEADASSRSGGREHDDGRMAP